MRLTIHGHIPGKKNMYLRSKNGRMFKNRALQDQVDSITLQIITQCREKFVKPSITAHFVCPDARSDLDNKWTTVEDCLVQAGVIENDNLNHLKGPITISGEVTRGSEFAIVEIL